MRRPLYAAAGLCLAHVVGLGLALGGEPGGSFGTSVDFFDTPTEAAKKAIKEEKLVFVLHVSGNFEDPRFT